MPRGPRVDFRINEDTSSCLVVVGPSLTKKVETLTQRKIWMVQASLYFGSGQIQFVVVVGSVANTGNDRTHPHRCISVTSHSVFLVHPSPNHTTFSFCHAETENHYWMQIEIQMCPNCERSMIKTPHICDDHISSDCTGSVFWMIWSCRPCTMYLQIWGVLGFGRWVGQGGWRGEGVTDC